jgi:NADPH-dependent 2,4-dienoyl-CoA reductase/sulfur reductase-like enzyme
VKTIVVIGGGRAGCAAAMQAARAGGRVFLIEKTDRLLGTGLAGGIMKNNGRWTVTEEVIEMGGGALFDILEKAYLLGSGLFRSDETPRSLPDAERGNRRPHRRARSSGRSNLITT